MQSNANLRSNQPTDPHLRPPTVQNYALQPPYPPESFGQQPHGQNAPHSMAPPHQAAH